MIAIKNIRKKGFHVFKSLFGKRLIFKLRDIVEKQKGMASLAHLAAVIDDKEIVLFIPADDKGEIKDVFTFGRVVGHIFYNEEDMSEHMIESGHATRYKVK